MTLVLLRFSLSYPHYNDSQIVVLGGTTAPVRDEKRILVAMAFVSVCTRFLVGRADWGWVVRMVTPADFARTMGSAGEWHRHGRVQAVAKKGCRC